MTAEKRDKAASAPRPSHPAVPDQGQPPRKPVAAERPPLDGPTFEEAALWDRTFDAVPDLVAIIDTKNRIMRVNKAMADRLRLTKEQCIGRTCFSCIHATDEPPAYCPHSQLLRDGREHAAEIHEERLGGDFLVTVSPLRDSGENLVGCVHVARDITERKRTEYALERLYAELEDRVRQRTAQLAESERRFRDLAELLPQTVFETDLEGGLTFVNRQALAMFGYTQAEFEEGLNCFDRFAAEDVDRARRNMQRILAGEDIGALEYTVKRKDGTQFPVMAYGFPILRGEAPVGVRGILVDMTEKKWAEEALRATVEWFRLTFDQSPIGAAIVSLDHRYIRVNEMLCRITGYPSAEMTRLRFSDITYPDDLPRELELIQRLIAGEIDHFEMDKRYLRKDGGVVWVRLVIRMARTAAGEPRSLLPTMQDITERKRAEEALRRSEKIRMEAEKLAATGRMAAQVAHEINNPLAGIKNSFRLIRDAVPKDHPDHDMVVRIEREIDRIAHIVRQMYELYSPRAQTPRTIPVGETIGDVVAMLEPLCREHEVSVECEAISPELTVRAYAGSLQQVLYNLLANAIQASPRAAVVHVAAELADEDHVRIAIRDRGPGIPADMRERMFEPFVSAETGGIPKQGLGLGLAVVRSIVDSLGGRIGFECTPGEGTCFHVYLSPKQP
jgi:PAS domain S-box-containing protein